MNALARAIHGVSPKKEDPMITEPDQPPDSMEDSIACSWCGSVAPSEGVCGQCGSPIQVRMPPLLVTG